MHIKGLLMAVTNSLPKVSVYELFDRFLKRWMEENSDYMDNEG
uniref:Hypotheticial protein n=1 Tax=Schistosoma japonicum TaxID=6182 RepID=C7TY58_SCHJA|nr:hypotheticial protein [Schistosoma japonicum]